MSYVYALLIIGFLILLHELGHFFGAKISGIPIERLSIGFGPKIFKFKRAETEYCVCAIPLGGYVLPLVKDEAEYFRLPVKSRLIMTLFGPLANIATVLILFSVLNTMQNGFTFFGSLFKPFAQTFNTAINMFLMLPKMFSEPTHLSGIVGIVSMGGKIVSSGLASILNFILIISLNLAVFNLLPIPAMDGRKAIMLILEKLDQRLVKLQIPFTIAGWAFLLLLMGFTTFCDIKNIIAGV